MTEKQEPISSWNSEGKKIKGVSHEFYVRQKEKRGGLELGGGCLG